MLKVKNKDFIVNFEHSSRIVLVFILSTLNRKLPTGWKLDFNMLDLATSSVHFSCHFSALKKVFCLCVHYIQQRSKFHLPC